MAKQISTVLLFILLFNLTSCSKGNETPSNNGGGGQNGITVTTIDVTNIKTIMATANCRVVVDSILNNISMKGIVWSTTQSPTIALATKTSDGISTGTFQSLITNLQSNTKYYIRAYAIDKNGNTIYGNEISFTTKVGWKMVKGGLSYFIGIRNDGTLWGWGNNESGQLGDGTSISRNIPVQISSDTNWLDIAPSNTSIPNMGWTMALKNDGTLWGWGKGYLGDGTTVPKFVPTKIGTDKWKQISTGTDNGSINVTNGIKMDGTLWYWGFAWNPNTNSESLALTPLQITGITNCKQVACGFNNTLIIKNDGTLWGYGYNSTLGTGGVLYTKVPLQQIGSANNWTKMYSHYQLATTIAIKSDGSCWGWGIGQNGEFGNATNVNFNIPTLISNNLGTNVNDMTYPNFSTFYVKKDGTLWGTGSGYLGDGTPFANSRFVFMQSGSLNIWVKVARANGTFCGIQNNGSLWVWGGPNTNGQLGIGDNNSGTYIPLLKLVD